MNEAVFSIQMDRRTDGDRPEAINELVNRYEDRRFH